MNKLKLLDKKGKELRELNVDKKLLSELEEKYNEEVLRDAVILQMANSRQGTKKTKTRAEVSGGGRKPWRQKGTGRARAGSNRSPIWVGGGVAHGVVPQDFSKKMNKKARKLALKSALFSKVNDLVVVDDLNLESSKTKEFKEILKNLKLENEKLLVIVKGFDDNLILASQASRNLRRVLLLEVSELNVSDLLNNTKILITIDALNEIKEAL